MGSDGIRKAAIIGLILAGACTNGARTITGPTTADHTPTPATNAAVANLLPTDAAALPDADPESFDELIGQLRGVPVVVNIWGSWCTPCREEAPHLAAAAREYGDRVQFVGINILDTREGARRYMEEFGIGYPSLFDPSPGGSIRSHLGYIGQPDTVFYDAEGNKVSDWEGAITAEKLDSEIRDLVASSPGGPAGV